MIIVSQDKGKIINFDNMTRVYIIFDEDDDVCIRTETVDSLYEDLGYYKTEARAKEVLKEIVEKYSSYLELKGGVAFMQGGMNIQPNIFNIPKVFEMPKE